MTLPAWFTPLRIGLSAAAVVAVVLLIVFYNPLTGFLRSQVFKAQAAEETAVDGQVSAKETLKGQDDVDDAAWRARDLAETARGSIHDVEHHARVAEDGEEPLHPAAADRLQRHDQFLCDLRPAVCGDRADSGAAAAGDAGRGA